MRNMHSGSHAFHFSVASTMMHLGTNRKAQQSCGSSTDRERVSLWDTALLTKANTIIMLEGGRLQPGDALDASRPAYVRNQLYAGDKGKLVGRTKS